jgi:hypothetical protein
VQEPDAQPAANEAVLKLVEVRFGDRADRHGLRLLSGKPEFTGQGEIVGIAGRIEGYTLADGTRKDVAGEWRLLNADELGYGTRSPVVQRCVLLHDRPWPPFSKVTLRIRAAVTERIERIEIDDFQPGTDQNASAHGLTLRIRSRLGKALGSHAATFLYPRITADGQDENTGALSAWSLTPAERQAVDESEMLINYRFGFVSDDGLLSTPSGRGNGYYFLGQRYAGRTFGANVPLNIRIVDEVLEIEMP